MTDFNKALAEHHARVMAQGEVAGGPEVFDAEIVRVAADDALPVVTPVSVLVSAAGGDQRRASLAVKAEPRKSNTGHATLSPTIAAVALASAQRETLTRESSQEFDLMERQSHIEQRKIERQGSGKKIPGDGQSLHLDIVRRNLGEPQVRTLRTESGAVLEDFPLPPPESPSAVEAMKRSLLSHLRSESPDPPSAPSSPANSPARPPAKSKLSPPYLSIEPERPSSLRGSPRARPRGGFAPVAKLDADEKESNVLQRIMARKGWLTPPTNNPHVLRSIVRHSDPWKGMSLALTKTADLSDALVSEVYFSSQSALAAFEGFRPPMGSVVVTGVPRCGQTPVLQVLDWLRRGKVDDGESLVERTMWPEAALASMHRALDGNPGRDVVKTHLPLLNILSGGATPRGHKAEVRAIVVLRDPVDVRASWFRHVRRVFRKFHPQAAFDTELSMDDFATVRVAACEMVASYDYEHFIALAGKAAKDKWPNVLVVFYEELLADPATFVSRLAEFTGWGADNDALLRNVVEATAYSPLHPSTRKRSGSSDSFHAYEAASVRHMDALWESAVRAALPQFMSYQALYEAFAGSPYPFPRATIAPRFSGFGSPPSASAAPSGRSGRNLIPRISSLSVSQQSAAGEPKAATSVRSSIRRLLNRQPSSSSSKAFETQGGNDAGSRRLSSQSLLSTATKKSAGSKDDLGALGQGGARRTDFSAVDPDDSE